MAQAMRSAPLEHEGKLRDYMMSELKETVNLESSLAIVDEALRPLEEIFTLTALSPQILSDYSKLVRPGYGHTNGFFVYPLYKAPTHRNCFPRVFHLRLCKSQTLNLKSAISDQRVSNKPTESVLINEVSDGPSETLLIFQSVSFCWFTDQRWLLPSLSVHPKCFPRVFHLSALQDHDTGVSFRLHVWTPTDDEPGPPERVHKHRRCFGSAVLLGTLHSEKLERVDEALHVTVSPLSSYQHPRGATLILTLI